MEDRITGVLCIHSPPFLDLAKCQNNLPFLSESRALFGATCHNWFPSSIMKNVISKVTGCLIWFFTSQRTHLGIWVDKNVSSAWCLSFQYGIFPWSPNLGENVPLESRRKRKQIPPGANVSCPVLRAVCLQRKNTWQAARPFCGRVQIFHHNGKIAPCVWLLSCLITIFLFCSLSHSSWEVAHFKRSEMTLILCFQKAHKQNLDTCGCVDIAYQ